MQTGQRMMCNKSMNDKNRDMTVTHLRPALPCPECGKSSNRENYPFCSMRCRALDLNRWLSGSYVLPGRWMDESDTE